MSNIQTWLEEVRSGKIKKAFPVLSFPCVHLLNVTVRELLFSSDLQAQGMKLVADRVNSAAAVSMMDLSVEAEAFGSNIVFSDDEVPTVLGAIIGCILYRFIIAIALRLDLPSECLKLVSAVIVAVAIALPTIRAKKGGK